MTLNAVNASNWARARDLAWKHSASIIAIGITVFLQVVYLFPLPDRWMIDSGLMGNFLTESYGILLTVVLLERLLRTEESLRNEKARQLANSEFTVVYSRCIELWTIFADATSDDAGPVPMFDASVAQRMRTVNVFGPAHVHPVRPINVYARQRLQELEKFIQTAMLRYVQYADMEVLEAVQEIERSLFLEMVRLCDVLAQSAQQRGQFPGFPAPDNRFEEMLPIEQLRNAINLSRSRLSPPAPPIARPMLRFRPPRPATAD